MNSNRTTDGNVSTGHVFFAVTMIGLGILGLVKGDFPSIWVPVPKAVPARAALIYATAVISLACGVGLLWRRTAAVAARVLLVYLLAWLLLLKVPHMLVAFAVDTWWAACKLAVMAAGAWIIYVRFDGERDGGRFRFARGESGVRIARLLYGVALIPFGLAHFIYLQQTAVLVPGWLLFSGNTWGYFTGCAFVAAGLAIVVGVWARLAAVLAAVQVGLFTLIVWVPVVAAGPNSYQWQEFVTSWAITAGAWMIADSY